MCFHCNITNACVRYIHIDMETPNGYSIAIYVICGYL